MNRNQYLQEFKNGLSLFEESYQQKKMLELDEKITKEIEKGKSEEEALKSLGDVSLEVNKVFKEHHLNFNSSEKKNSFFSSKYDSIYQVINHVIDVMSKNSAKANGKILFDLLILILLVCIIKIPFILVRDLVESLLAFLSMPFIITLWHFIIEVIYIIIAITVFLNIFKRWFKNLKVGK